jgi:hypothetical protein
MGWRRGTTTGGALHRDVKHSATISFAFTQLSALALSRYAKLSPTSGYLGHKCIVHIHLLVPELCVRVDLVCEIISSLEAIQIQLTAIQWVLMCDPGDAIVGLPFSGVRESSVGLPLACSLSTLSLLGLTYP